MSTSSTRSVIQQGHFVLVRLPNGDVKQIKVDTNMYVLQPSNYLSGPDSLVPAVQQLSQNSAHSTAMT
jgi:hypothetical protein